jgi:hypothetical protein
MRSPSPFWEYFLAMPPVGIVPVPPMMRAVPVPPVVRTGVMAVVSVPPAGIPIARVIGVAVAGIIVIRGIVPGGGIDVVPVVRIPVGIVIPRVPVTPPMVPVPAPVPPPAAGICLGGSNRQQADRGNPKHNRQNERSHHPPLFRFRAPKGRPPEAPRSGLRIPTSSNAGMYISSDTLQQMGCQNG